jgi:hypothetical protein
MRLDDLTTGRDVTAECSSPSNSASTRSPAPVEDRRRDPLHLEIRTRSSPCDRESIVADFDAESSTDNADIQRHRTFAVVVCGGSTTVAPIVATHFPWTAQRRRSSAKVSVARIGARPTSSAQRPPRAPRTAESGPAHEPRSRVRVALHRPNLR